ncbi:rRNA biogenesis protein rrp5 [Petralouisia muris]|uniref:rRNA biogenesis protein rrp5 n=1 Tax=Petralouisia muris TaxID=3032872 RepID=UPI0023B81650|nr:rRNA biogenesis protein rrp5 [Petralouisia muris]
MGKVKLLPDVIGDLRSLADGLQAIADAVADNSVAEAEMTTTKEPEETGKAGRNGKTAKNTAKKDAKAAKQEPEEKPLTLEEVRAVLAEKSRSGHTEEVRELPVDFNEKLFRRLVDYATVYPDDRVAFTFRNGAEVSTEI